MNLKVLLFPIISSVFCLSEFSSASESNELHSRGAVTTTTTPKPISHVQGKQSSFRTKTGDFDDPFDINEENDTPSADSHKKALSLMKGCEDREYNGGHDGPRYKFSRDQASWYEAATKCRQIEGGRWELASVKCQFEQLAIERELGSSRQPFLRHWINGNDFRKKGEFEWGDPSTYSPFSSGPMWYTKWSKDQPDNFDKYGEEHCVEMISDRNYEWNDFTCQSPLAFICQKVR